MALASDGTLNTKKIEKEMAAALDEDVRYYKTDEMKKRAIKSARSYDEFKGLVACACLKPVSREDIESLGKSKKGWASTVVSKKVTTTSSHGASGGNNKGLRRRGQEQQQPGGMTTKLGLSREGGTTTNKIRSSMEFEREWRRMGSDPQERYRYLHTVGPASLLELFKSEMDAALMGDIIDTLHHVYYQSSSKQEQLPVPPPRRQEPPAAASSPAGGGGVQDDDDDDVGKTSPEVKEEGTSPSTGAAAVLSILRCLPQTGRFTLSFSFLTASQRAKAASLVKELLTTSTASSPSPPRQGEGAALKEKEGDMQALAEAFKTVL